MTDLSFRLATADDATALSELGKRCFTENFAHLYTTENLQLFLQENYAPEVMAAEIADTQNRIMLAFYDERMAGYTKLRPNQLPVNDAITPAYEIQRLYVHSSMQGRGLGKLLMEEALDFFKNVGAKSVYLGVWSENYRAHTFYRNYGFEKIGEYFFLVGDQTDDEWIMKWQKTG